MQSRQHARFLLFSQNGDHPSFPISLTELSSLELHQRAASWRALQRNPQQTNRLATDPCAHRGIDDRYEEAKRLARAGPGRHSEALPLRRLSNGLRLMAMESDRLPVDTEDAGGVGKLGDLRWSRFMRRFVKRCLHGQRRSGARLRGKQGTAQSIDDRGLAPPPVIYDEPPPLFDTNRGADSSPRDTYGLGGRPALRASGAGSLELICLAQGKVILAASTFRR
jgi:hypothetical protein